ncbi:MAG: hypothetical protein ACLPWD_05845 [Methanobacterium sp.]
MCCGSTGERQLKEQKDIDFIIKYLEQREKLTDEQKKAKFFIKRSFAFIMIEAITEDNQKFWWYCSS